MSDELYDDAPTEEQPETETETPELSPEQIARAWLAEQGIEEFDPKKVKNLDKWERSLNERSTIIGAAAKQFDTQMVTSPSVEEVEVDEDDKAAITKLLKAIGIDPATFQEVVTTSKQTLAEQRESTFESFMAAHADVDASELVGELVESGIDFDRITPMALSKELTKAYKVVKANALDPEAIKKAAVEEYLASLKQKGAAPDDIVEVKKGAGSAAGGHRSREEMLNSSDVSFFDKLNTLAGG